MFNEKEYEYLNGEKLEVWQTPKYLESRAKAIDMINSDYGLTEADFWILMNKTKSGKVAYTGLIISHNGCLKINDKLAEKRNEFKSDCLSEPIPFEFNGQVGLRQVYQEEPMTMHIGDTEISVGSDIYEVGEISNVNLKNAYPFAMLLKRTFDRVVLKKSKLAYSGIYSEVEADEFREPIEEQPDPITEKQLNYIRKMNQIITNDYLKALGKKELSELTKEEASQLIVEVKK